MTNKNYMRKSVRNTVCCKWWLRGNYGSLDMPHGGTELAGPEN